MGIGKILAFANEKGASDLHISSGEPPIVRIDGDIQKVDMPSLPGDEVHSMLYDILNDQQRKIFEEKKEIDFALDVKGIARFRVNAFYQSRGEAIVFRTIPSIIKSLEELGLPMILADLTKKTKGLVLVTGPTGSGKSTTLAAMIDHRNSNSPGHIITVEDPVEFVHPHKKSVVTQREVGIDTNSFGEALKNTLRQAPDVILVGEIRDTETMEAAITFAETGHLCLATLHANNANQSLERIINFFPAERHEQIYLLLSLNLKSIISQRLIPTIEDTRVAALEILLDTPRIKDLILKKEIGLLKETMKQGVQEGMQTFDQAIYDFYMQGKIDYETAIAYADSANDLRLRIKFDTPGHEGQEEETENKSTFKIREQ
jgi:twitching motility protein PilU